MAGFTDARAATTATDSGLEGTMYVSLHADGGAELSGNGYARAAVTFTETARTWNADADASFTASGGDWLEAVSVKLWTVATGGVAEYEEDLIANKIVTDGEDATIPASNLTVTI